MICPQCHRPYFFIHHQNTSILQCQKCQYEAPFQLPDYDNYHENFYTAKAYTRTEQTDPQMRTILKELAISSGQRVLDIGCGVGDYTKAIFNYTQHIIGLDQSVLSAQKKYPEVFFYACDCNQRLPYADQSIDVIVSINLIEHLINYENLLTECHRVLKPAGKIALTTANLDFILHDFFYDKTHVHEWTLPQFTSLVARYFEPKRVEKSSSMFNYHPYNKLLTKALKPDLLFIGIKK